MILFLKNIYTSFFEIKSDSRKWYHAMIWWEIRRIPFNIIILVSGIISILLLHLVVKGAMDFIHPFAVFAFAFFANFFYTLGWILELFLMLFSKKYSMKFAKSTLKIGLIFSILCTLFPVIAFSVTGIITGEKVASPYYNFTTKKPLAYKLIGKYRIDTSSKMNLKDEDLYLIEEARIELLADNTFTFYKLPLYDGFGRSYDIVNGKGKWELKKREYPSNWVLFVYLKKINVMSSENINKEDFMTSYFLCNNKPPYDIYIIIGDPDSWEGIRFQKIE